MPKPFLSFRQAITVASTLRTKVAKLPIRGGIFPRLIEAPAQHFIAHPLPGIGLDQPVSECLARVAFNPLDHFRKLAFDLDAQGLIP